MTVVFGVDFDSLGADLAASLRTVDSVRLRVVPLSAAEAQDARLVAVASPIEPALASAIDSGAEVVAIGDEALEAEALDAGAADFVAWPGSQHSLAAQLGAAARRLNRARQQRSDFERLRRLDEVRVRIAQADTDLPTLAQMVCDELLGCDHLRAMTQADGAVVEMLEGEEIAFLAASGIVAQHRDFRMPRPGTLSDLVIESAEIQISTDTEADPRVNRDASRVLGVRSMVATPLICDGGPVGVLKMVSAAANSFDGLDQRILRTMGELVSAALQREIGRGRLRERLEEHGRALETLRQESDSLRSLATIDPLTGLLNRRHFAVVADEAVRRGGGRAMLILDLDQFKSINDSHGHAAGDAVLVAVAGWINASVRDGDLVGRIGGEEFAILLPRVDQDAAIATAERIRAAIEAGAVPFDGEWLRTTVSIGIALVGIARTHEDSLRRADSALYRAKDGGRNRVILHDDSSVVRFPETGAS